MADLIRPDILGLFRGQSAKLQEGWTEIIDSRWARDKGQQELLNECVEACAALLWWGHGGSKLCQLQPAETNEGCHVTGTEGL